MQSILVKRKAQSMNNIIAELRKAGKVSQSELAAAVGVTRQTITSLETGKYTASLPLAFKIARFFGCSIEEIFEYEGE
jgi:putative transcriptional regulator